jgi:hypothetical protein
MRYECCALEAGQGVARREVGRTENSTRQLLTCAHADALCGPGVCPAASGGGRGGSAGLEKQLRPCIAGLIVPPAPHTPQPVPALLATA